jgi:hypothetical protein
MLTTNVWIIYIEIANLRSPTNKDELFIFNIDIADYGAVFYNFRTKI